MTRGPAAHWVRFEGELAIVIGKTCAGVSESRAPEHVLGYTCANAT